MSKWYEIFVHDFTESFPGQLFKGQGEAQVLLRLMCGKTCVWKAAAAKLKRPNTKTGPLIWSEKIVLPPQFVSGLNVLEVSLVKSGVAFVKDIVNVDLDAHSFPKDFQVLLTKIKGTLHFTIDSQSDEVVAKKSSDRKAMDRLSLSPRASRRLAAALETEKHGSGTAEGRSLKGSNTASASTPAASVGGPPLPPKNDVSNASSSNMTAGEQQAVLRREREVTRREEDLVRREEALKTAMAGLSKKDEAPPAWKKFGSAFEKLMLAEREKLTEALAKLDFSLCHDIVNNMAESYEDNGGVDERSSSILSDASDLSVSLAAALGNASSSRGSSTSERFERAPMPEPISFASPVASPRLPPPLAVPMAAAAPKGKSPDLPAKKSLAAPANKRSIAEVERDIAFAVGASDFQRAIELREELKRLGGSVPSDDASGDPFADGPPSKVAPPRPVKGSSIRTPQSSGSGVSQLTDGTAEQIDAEITKLTTAMNATKALADKWAAIGNNGARQAAEDQVAQMQREIADLQKKRGGGGGGGGGGVVIDQYQALPASATQAIPNIALPPPPAALAPSTTPPPASAGVPGAASGAPPRPAMRPPPRQIVGRLQSSRLPARPMAAGLPQLPSRAASERTSDRTAETAAAVASLPMPPEVNVIPAAVSASDGDDPFVGRDISGPMLTIRSAKAMQTKLAGSSARGIAASSATLTTTAAAASPGAVPAVTAQDRAMRRRSQSLNSLMAAAKGAVPTVATVEVARAMKAAGAGEPDVDAMVSQAQREQARQNAAAPSAELADKYIMTDDSGTVAISNTQTRGSGRAEYTVYVIDVSRGASSWTVFRRFQQFEELRDKLKRSVPGGVPPDFPSKEGNKKDAGVIELRRRELEKFLLALHAHPGTLASPDFRTFLAPTQLMDIKPK